jgi:CBS domain-containing membrane protein
MPRQSHLLTVHTAIVSAAVTAVPGIVALLTGQLLLFPSLGPTAVMLSYEPEHRSARLYNVIVSHIGGLLSGFAAVLLFGLAHAPSVFHVRALSAPRVAAAVLAVLLAVLVELVLDAAHPPATATTLLAALGSFRPTWHDGLTVVAGVLVVACAGELGRLMQRRARAAHAQP